MGGDLRYYQPTTTNRNLYQFNKSDDTFNLLWLWTLVSVTFFDPTIRSYTFMVLNKNDLFTMSWTKGRYVCTFMTSYSIGVGFDNDWALFVCKHIRPKRIDEPKLPHYGTKYCAWFHGTCSSVLSQVVCSFFLKKKKKKTITFLKATQASGNVFEQLLMLIWWFHCLYQELPKCCDQKCFVFCSFKNNSFKTSPKESPQVKTCKTFFVAS